MPGTQKCEQQCRVGAGWDPYIGFGPTQKNNGLQGIPLVKRYNMGTPAINWRMLPGPDFTEESGRL